MKIITITIDPCGRPTIDAQGFTGTSCKDATKAIEKALSANNESVDRQEKPEIKLFGGGVMSGRFDGKKINNGGRN